MNLDELKRHWDAFGERDPLWAILTDPARKGGRWEVGEFFATGTAEVAALMADAAALGLPRQRRRGLDFGCGVGRLTQALADHVEQAIGLDVAPSMIVHARDFNRRGERVRYDVQAAPPLEGVATRSMDVVITGRVLQHIAPEFSRRYVSELARVLAPGGFLSFDLPSRSIEPDQPAGAMAPGACRAAIMARRRATADDRLALDVVVTNAGDGLWPAGIPLNLGSHWLAGDGAVIAFDGPRAALPLPIGPGQSATVVYAPGPAPSGATVLELDVVHEGVTWFAWAGSPTIRISLDGQSMPPPAAPIAAPPGRFEPVMEMHAVPRPEVEALLRDAGVRLLRVRPEAHCGPRWEAWRYDVTADAAG